MKKFALICLLLIAAMGAYGETRFYVDANMGIESTTLHGEQNLDITGFTMDVALGNVVLPEIGIGIAGLLGLSAYSHTTADAVFYTEDLTRLRFGVKVFYAPLRSLQIFASPCYLVVNGNVDSNEIVNTKGFGVDAGISFFPIRKYACSPTLNVSYRYNIFGDIHTNSAVFTVGFVRR
ncbi:hypothetical protein FACS189445_1620 [Spirochaetia bacterium]|nr:hypothetical protein FACS189445_1620 [Spirochaetia bacterium]